MSDQNVSGNFPTDQRPAFTTKRASLAERGHDLYETPPEATLALLEVERLPKRVWEPACGPGAIVTVLRAAGHDVVASDLVDYGDPTHFYRRDFLIEHRAPDGIEAIITNPPYKLADEFVAHAIGLCPRVIMLLRLGFLESERRRPILDNGMLARVYVFRNRLPMMHRAGWAGPAPRRRFRSVGSCGTARIAGRPNCGAFRGGRDDVARTNPLKKQHPADEAVAGGVNSQEREPLRQGNPPMLDNTASPKSQADLRAAALALAAKGMPFSRVPSAARNRRLPTI